MRVNYYGKDYLLVIGIYHDSVTGKYYNGCFYNNARVFYVGRADVNDSSGYHSRASYLSDASFDPTSSTVASSTSINDLFWNNNQTGIYKGAAYWMDLGSSGTNIVRGDASVLKLYQNSINLSETDIASVNTLPVAFDNGTSSASAIVKGYNDLSESDLADSKLVKILELPYCPSNITNSSGNYTLNSNFTYDGINKTLKYNNLRQSFSSTLTSWTLGEYSCSLSGTAASRVLWSRSQTREPKLYHSDFYVYKLVYDGACKQIKLEDIVPTSTLPEIEVTFKPTNTIGSSLAFIYDFTGATYSAEEDYPVLISSRDNSLPIYNNDYINYMRYTYAADRNNIDATQKAKEISIGVRAASTAVSTAGGAAIGFATGHVAGAVIGAVVGAATGIISTINASVQADTNIENANRSLSAKMSALQNQPVTASGAVGAVDIMKGYSDNKLHRMIYQPNDDLKKALFDKFYYCGYAHPVQDVPDFGSRFWFNFVQCNPVFTDEGESAYTKYLDDFKERFKIGVTVYHYHPIVLLDGYDWDQRYENWETTKVSGAESLPNPSISGNISRIDITNEDEFQPASTNNYRYEVQYQSSANQTYEIYPGNNQYTTQSYYRPTTDWDINCTNPDSSLNVIVRARLVDISTGLTSDWTTLNLGNIS